MDSLQSTLLRRFTLSFLLIFIHKKNNNNNNNSNNNVNWNVIRTCSKRSLSYDIKSVKDNLILRQYNVRELLKKKYSIKILRNNDAEKRVLWDARTFIRLFIFIYRPRQTGNTTFS